MKTKALQFGKALSAALFVLLLSVVGMTKADPVDEKTAHKAAQSFLNAKMGNYPKIVLINFAENLEWHDH